MRVFSVPLFYQPMRSGTELPSMGKCPESVHPVLCRLGSVAHLLSEYASVLQAHKMQRTSCILSTSAYWSEVGLGIMLFLFVLVGWTFYPYRADLVLGKCFKRLGGRWVQNCTFSVGIRICQTCQSTFWCLVFIMGVYTVLYIFCSLFLSSITWGLCL